MRERVEHLSLSDRRLATFASLIGLTLFVCAMVLVRVVYSPNLHYGGLIWNLVLAWIPFVLALVVYDGYRRGARPRLLVGASLLWLLFFPNAPYIVTDLKHLREWDGMPLLYDVVLVAAAAWGGLLLGFISLYLMHSVARRVVGATAAWAGVLAVFALSAYGIYLGRFQRWNSWDLFVRPDSLLADGWARLGDDPRALAVTVLFTAFLAATYLVFYAFARLSLAVGERGRE